MQQCEASMGSRFNGFLLLGGAARSRGAGLGRRGHGEMDKVKAGDQGAIQNVRKGENNRKKLETECRGKEEM